MLLVSRFIKTVRLSSPDFAARTAIPLLSALALAFLLVSCGGGGGGGTGTSQTLSPSFSLSVSPTGITIEQGGQASISLSVAGTNGFSSPVSVDFSGLPAGVTASPATLSISPGAPQQVTISAANSAAISQSTITFTGASSSLSGTADLSLAVIAVPTSNTPPSRTRYVETDSTTPYFLFPNSKWIIYNPPTNRFFLADPDMNCVIVLDAATEKMVGSIPVPGAFSVDDTPDHSTLYVGTQMGDVYEISASTMAVTHRYLASQIGPYGFKAYSVLVMADGRLALLGGEGGLPVDGFADFAIWNPSDNSITIYASSYGGGEISGPFGSVPYTTVCGPMLNIGVFNRTPDRTRVLLASIDSDGTVCELNETTGASSYVDPGIGFVPRVTQTPDGKLLLVPEQEQYSPSGGPVLVLDANTLAKVGQFNVAGDVTPAGASFVSPDSSTFYITSQTNIVYAYSLSTYQLIGWFPSPWVISLAGGLDYGPPNVPDIQAADGNGLLAGPMEEGVGFLDVGSMRTGAVGTQVTNACFDPVTGPPSGDTRTTSLHNVLSGSVPLSSVYVGGQAAPSATVSSYKLSITTPPGAPGPAGVYASLSDGGELIVPDGFSYGPTILEATPNMSPAGGGGTGVVYGYGFGPPNEITGIPPGLQVTVGGQPAKITGYAWNAYNNSYNPPCPPLPLQAFAYTIPPGVNGLSADVTVSTNSGSTTLHGGMTYIPSMDQFALAGASLAQGIYDPYNDLYYFTDATSLRVFSLSSGAWQTPIAIPGAERLWGLGLSPDGSKLAIADVQADKIYILDPANPSAIQSYPVPQPGTGAQRNPVGVAVSDAGAVYFAAETLGGSGYTGFFKLDTSSGQVTDYGIDSPDIYSNGQALDSYLRTLISPDGSSVYFNADGLAFRVDTATDNVSYASEDPGCCYGNYDLAVSANPTRVAATGYYYDANLNAESYQALNIREAMNVSYVNGEKLSPDGSLLFKPTTEGIDVFDARVGRLLESVSLPVTLSANYDALVSDGTDNVLVAITGSGDGIAEINLSSIPEPAPISYPTSIAAPRPAQEQPAKRRKTFAFPSKVPYVTTTARSQRRAKPK